MKNVISETERDWPAIQAYLQNTGYPKLVTEVDARDEMYIFGLQQSPANHEMARVAYFRCGVQLASASRQIFDWYFGKDAGPKKILDFASGYGRGTRFMLMEFEQSEILSSDILPGAMEFQSKILKTNTKMSATDPRDLDLGGKFDFIWVISLFSHLPDRTFKAWLGQLYELLTPNGCLAFSLHDVSLLPAGDTMPESGMLFHSSSEIPTLDTEDYGVSFVTEDYVARAVREATGQETYRRFPRMIVYQQDMYVVAKGDIPKEDFQFKHKPYGHLDHCEWIADNRLRMSGWAWDFTPDEEIDRVDIFLNNKKIGEAKPSYVRPDLEEPMRSMAGELVVEIPDTGWSCEVATDSDIKPYNDVVLANAVSTSGEEFCIGCGLVASVSVFEQQPDYLARATEQMEPAA